MGSQLVLIETAPLVTPPKGIIEVARGVFRNLDTGITWSMYRRKPYCSAMKHFDRASDVHFICNRSVGHRGKHKNTSHATGCWVRTRWNEDECYVLPPPIPRPIGCEPNPVGPRRQLPLASKQSIRRKALRRRMTLKNPIFAEDEIARAFDRDPGYYGGIRP